MKVNIIAKDADSYIRLLAVLKERKIEPDLLNSERLSVAAELDEQGAGLIRQEGYEVHEDVQYDLEQNQRSKMRVRIIDTKIDRTQRPIPKNFGIKLTDKEILVPQELVTWLGGSNVRTPEELVSIIRIFPNTLATLFGASIEEVAKTQTQLFAQLQGKVSDDCLNPLPPKRPSGALAPYIPDLPLYKITTADKKTFDVLDRMLMKKNHLNGATIRAISRLNLAIAVHLEENLLQELKDLGYSPLEITEKDLASLSLF